MQTTTHLVWLAAAVCFIFSLSGLSKHETARRGNWLGIAGILLAIGATFFTGIHPGFVLLIFVLVIGASIGCYLAQKVEMTAMPQLVAILHSFVGLAAVLVGLSVFLSGDTEHVAMIELQPIPQAVTFEALTADLTGTNLVPMETQTKLEADWHSHDLIHRIEIFLGLFIGGLTFTGSIIAFGKLDGRINSKPLMIPARHWINAGMLLVCLLLGWWFIATASWGGMLAATLLMLIISFVFGAHLVMAIGGADMPVVVSMLNSYSGWAAAATGFMLSNDLLIITGALVGSSGAILSYIMCHAMNRSFISVILGGFGVAPAAKANQRKNRKSDSQSNLRWRSGVDVGRSEASDHHSRLRHGGCSGSASNSRDCRAFTKERGHRSIRDSSGCRTFAGPHECVVG